MDIPYLIFFSPLRRDSSSLSLSYLNPFLLLVCYRNTLGAQNNRATLRRDISRFYAVIMANPFCFCLVDLFCFR